MNNNYIYQKHNINRGIKINTNIQPNKNVINFKLPNKISNPQIMNYNQTHSRNNDNRNGMNLIDKITILKRSVDKYSEEARRKVENQLLKNTLQTNDSGSLISKTITMTNGTNNGSNRNKDNVLYKKVNSISQKLNNIKRYVISPYNV